MPTYYPPCFQRPRAALLGLMALSASLAGCAGESADPEGFDISMRPGEAPPTAPECVTLAPTGDAMISNPPKAQNYGGHPLLRVGGKDESLVRFDLSSIPAGSSIDSATLRLYLNGGAGTNPVSIHAATSAWAEGTVTYQSFDQDFDPAVAGVIQPDSPTALKSADVTGLVTSWLLGGLPNHGMLLETTGNQKNIFVSREGADGYRPALEVCYTPTVVDLCADEPCQNGGTCENTEDGYTCTCTPGYEGTDCETDIDECAGDPCVNGSCADGVAGYACACDVGWEGTNCETNTDDCAGDPCQNGGICTDGLAGYTCECDAGYTGANCETNIDDCAGAPCQNGGSCTDGVNSYDCACPTGYAGDNCELNVDDCVGNACENESTCVDGVAAYTCACLPGFTGTYCDEDIDDCAGEPCLNGGECTDGVNAYDCACPAGYTGDNCEVDIDECESNPCLNGQCVDLVAAWECQCDPGWEGLTCDTEIVEGVTCPCIEASEDFAAILADPFTLGEDGSCNVSVDYTVANVYGAGIYPPEPGFLDSAVVSTYNGQPACFTTQDVLYQTDITGTGELAIFVTPEEAAACGQAIAAAAAAAGLTCNVDDCVSPNPCQNGGSCTDEPGVGNYTCECAFGYSGTNCEIVDSSACPCLDPALFDGGYAVFVQSVLTSATACDTSVEGSGSIVGINLADVSDRFYVEGGFCSTDFIVLNGLPAIPTTQSQAEGCIAVIEAAAAAASLSCDGVVDECATNPCQNGGSCSDGPGSGDFTCACQPGWDGATCETAGYSCSGTNNPCTSANIEAGLLFFPNANPANYVECSQLGDCYVQSCGSGTWDQAQLQCV